jgi:tRNA(fMet)-specific endonuclease VapC
MSAITLSELFHSAENSARVSENLFAIEDFVSRIERLQYTPKASQHYGSIRAALKKQRRVIRVNDLHIAAHARSEGLTVVTNNTDEFTRVPSLLVENWFEAKDYAEFNPVTIAGTTLRRWLANPSRCGDWVVSR